MAAKNVCKIQSILLHQNRNYCQKNNEESSFWSFWGKSKEKAEAKPAIERCRKRKAYRKDPDLSGYGGQPYRTCGSAYVIQKDIIPDSEGQRAEEDRHLMTIEAGLSNKDNVVDPMPPFRSVEQRMIDLTERKLHPFYKRYRSLPNKDYTEMESPQMPFLPYKCKVGPVEADEIPDILKLNKQLLEKKNIFADFKRVELPKQMVVRIVEMQKNKRPTLEKKEEK